MSMGVAPNTHLRTCVLKIVHIHGKSHNVVTVFFITKGTALKGNNSLPLRANSFLKEKSQRDATDENHCSLKPSPFDVRNYNSVLVMPLMSVQIRSA